MTRDFTVDVYEALLRAGQEAGYDHLTVRDYLERETLPERFIIHRHDVDRKPENALTMARVEATRGIASTYYFRTIEKTFRPDLIREIDGLGHEIGYHYEDLDRASGGIDAAHASFDRELDRLRDLVPVRTICMHGNPLTRYDNREMWTGNRTFDEYDLSGEAYLSMDFDAVTYFSDTGRTWADGTLKIKDHTMGEGTKRVHADSTGDLIDLLANRRVRRACVLSHPNRWAASLGEYIGENLKDRSINVVKYALALVR